MSRVKVRNKKGLVESYNIALNGPGFCDEVKC